MDRQQIARRGALAALIVVGVLLVDQLIKIWVKTNMTLHEQIEILSWFKIVFIENKTYGIDRITGKLIPAERLRAVPHATLSVESKELEKKLK